MDSNHNDKTQVDTSTYMNELQREEWRLVERFPWFEVSNKGRLKLILTRGGYSTDKLVRLRLNDKGYVIVSVSRGLPKGVRKKYYVHRLVAEAFIPNPNKLPWINHINGDPTDNRVDNLEWCTEKYNRFHAAHILNKKMGDPEKPVLQFSLNGDLIKAYPSLYAAGLDFNNNRAGIRDCCSGKYKTAHGYIWRFAATEVEANQAAEAVRETLEKFHKDHTE